MFKNYEVTIFNKKKGVYITSSHVETTKEELHKEYHKPKKGYIVTSIKEVI